MYSTLDYGDFFEYTNDLGKHYNPPAKYKPKEDDVEVDDGWFFPPPKSLTTCKETLLSLRDGERIFLNLLPIELQAELDHRIVHDNRPRPSPPPPVPNYHEPSGCFAGTLTEITQRRYIRDGKMSLRQGFDELGMPYVAPLATRCSRCFMRVNIFLPESTDMGVRLFTASGNGKGSEFFRTLHEYECTACRKCPELAKRRWWEVEEDDAAADDHSVSIGR